MVVDDDRRMCELLSTGLGRKGFDVTTRQSAEEAFELVGRGDVDVVVAVHLEVDEPRHQRAMRWLGGGRPHRHHGTAVVTAAI